MVISLSRCSLSRSFVQRNNAITKNAITNKGVVLLSVVIILLTIALIGASLVAFFSSVNLSAQTIADEAKAVYLAEAGIAHVIRILRGQADQTETSEQTIGPVSLGEGTYTVKLDFNKSLITSTGEVSGIKKTIQLQYRSL